MGSPCALRAPGYEDPTSSVTPGTARLEWALRRWSRACASLHAQRGGKLGVQIGVLGGSREQLVDTQAGAGMPVKLAPAPSPTCYSKRSKAGSSGRQAGLAVLRAQGCPATKCRG